MRKKTGEIEPKREWDGERTKSDESDQNIGWTRKRSGELEGKEESCEEYIEPQGRENVEKRVRQRENIEVAERNKIRHVGRR